MDICAGLEIHMAEQVIISIKLKSKHGETFWVGSARQPVTIRGTGEGMNFAKLSLYQIRVLRLGLTPN